MNQKISVVRREESRTNKPFNTLTEVSDALMQFPLFPEEILPLGEICVPTLEPERRQEDWVLLLREANEKLICAALAAKGLQIKAEIAKKKQDEFLAMLAHELRNPLAPIVLAAELLQRIPNLPGSVAGIRQIIARQSSHLSHLVDQLLDSARLSNGDICIAPKLVDLMEIIQCAMETSQPVIAHKKQHVHLTCSPDSVLMHGDTIRLTQVFSNLLINASKFSDEGARIWLTVNSNTSEIYVSVKDEGVGIAAEFLPHVFDLFTQAPQSLAREKGGLGVGLTLVRSITKMHGGSVSAYSIGIGCGSEFTVRLPRGLQGQ